MKSTAVRRIAAALTIAACTTLSTITATGTAEARTQVGELSQFGHLKPYCQKFSMRWLASRWNISASPSSATDPYTWKCRFFPGIATEPIDMNAACRYYYGSSYAIATNTGWSWGSWKCFR